MTTEKRGTAPFLDWAKARLDEMDATVTSLKSEAGKLKVTASKNAETVLADILKQRDAFSSALKKQETAAEDVWAKTKTTLEAEWKAFETNVQRYFEETRNQTGQQVAVFRASAEAQRKTWLHAIEEIQKATAGVAAEQKTQAEAVMKRMKADADAAKVKLDALGHSATESWSAYKAGLTATLAAFDHASQAAQDVFKRAA